MAIDKALEPNNNLDVIEQGSSVTIPQEPSRQDMISDAAQILVNEDEILIGDELEQEPMPEMDFDSNLVDFIDPTTLTKIASDLISSVESTTVYELLHYECNARIRPRAGYVAFLSAPSRKCI